MINWLKPTNVEQAKWDWWLAGPFPAKVAKLLADHQVTVVSVHPDNSFYAYLKVRKDDRIFTVGLNEITSEYSLKEVAGFLKHWDKTVKAYNDSAKILDPFFDNLWCFIKASFKDCQGRGKAIQVLNEWVKASGRRVWT